MLLLAWGCAAPLDDPLACAVKPPPPSRTNWTHLVPPSRNNWTRLVPPPVLIGHVSSLPSLARSPSRSPSALLGCLHTERRAARAARAVLARRRTAGRTLLSLARALPLLVVSD